MSCFYFELCAGLFKAGFIQIIKICIQLQQNIDVLDLLQCKYIYIYIKIHLQNKQRKYIRLAGLLMHVDSLVKIQWWWGITRLSNLASGMILMWSRNFRALQLYLQGYQHLILTTVMEWGFTWHVTRQLHSTNHECVRRQGTVPAQHTTWYIFCTYVDWTFSQDV